MTDAEVRRPVAGWLWGGGLLIGSALVPVLSYPGDIGGGEVILWVGRALFAASLIVFAFGMRGEGSVVARRPVGIAALLVLAVAPPLMDVVVQQAYIAVLGNAAPVADSAMGVLQLLGYLQTAIWGAAALVVVIEIARARVLPHPWRWAPTWGLAVVALLYVIAQLIGVTAGAQNAAAMAVLFAIGWFAAGLVVPVCLGVLAMALGARGRAEPAVQVYPPAA